jgi:hypothetical protein
VAAASVGAVSRLYRLVCSDEESWRRIEERNRALPDGLFIARNTFEILKARFEPLDDDEDRIEIAEGSLPTSGRP